MENSDKQEPKHGVSEPQAVVLVHIVSPSSEVPGRLTFPDVPLMTTIGDMKKKIQDSIPTKPGPERQRLIYRGRALGQQETTLGALFGSEAVNI